MKKGIILLCVLLFTGCEKLSNVDGSNIIPFSVKEVASNQVTVNMTNESFETIYYGNPWHLEKKKNNRWYIVTPKEDLTFTLPLYSLKKGETKEWTINFEYNYGNLEKGTYRIVKEVSTNLEEKKDYPITAEFTIE